MQNMEFQGSQGILENYKEDGSSFGDTGHGKHAMGSRTGTPGQKVIRTVTNTHRILTYCRGSKPEGREEPLSNR